MANNPDRQLLQHFLASIAYHAQKGIRSAPSGYWTFSAGNRVRTPESMLRHMTGLLVYARIFGLVEAIILKHFLIFRLK